MDKIYIKKIKNYILNNKLDNDDIEELKKYLKEDYEAAMQGIFSSLIPLLKKYEQSKANIDKIITLLETTIKEKEGNELKLLIGLIIDFKNKINQFKRKQKILINEPYFRIDNILLEINNKLTLEISNKKIKYLEYLIFQEKNITMVENYLKENDNILNYQNKDGDNIFSLLIRKYIILDKTNYEDINYYFQIIMLFFKGIYGNVIIKDKNKYLRIINEYQCREEKHVERLINLFDSKFTITLEQLEDNYHIKFEFPEIIIKECNNFFLDQNNSYDFTYQNCITMDGKNALCLDDAIYIEKNTDGTYTLYIHITDIPSMVPYNSLTNEEARERCETIHLRDRTINLYPDIICNNICSLSPNETKNVITYIFKLDPQYNLIDEQYNIVKGKIKVAHKMTYEEVDERIINPQKEELDKILLRLTCFAEKRRNNNKEKELYREYENKINAANHHESMKLDTSIAANIVHESMILVNYSDAKYFKDKSLPYVYRKVFLPSDEFIHDVVQKIKVYDNTFKTDEKTIRKMKFSYIKGVYSNKPAYHDGLKLECYSHSTSPARRYADSFNQYIIYDLIFNQNITEDQIKIWEYRIKQIVNYLNQKKEENEVFSHQYNYLSYKKLIKTKK